VERGVKGNKSMLQETEAKGGGQSGHSGNPEPSGAILGAAGNEGGGGGEGDGEHRVRVASEAESSELGLKVPEHHAFVGARGRQLPHVRIKRQPGHRASVAFERALYLRVRLLPGLRPFHLLPHRFGLLFKRSANCGHPTYYERRDASD